MPTSGQKRTRKERVAALELPPGPLLRFLEMLWRPHVLGVAAVSYFAACCLCYVYQGWNPSFAYRAGDMPATDIVASTAFSVFDRKATTDAKELAQSRVRCIFVQNSQPLAELRELVRNKVAELLATGAAPAGENKLWTEFLPIPSEEEPPITTEQRQKAFAAFKAALDSDAKLAKFEKDLAAAMAPFEERGLLAKLSREPGKGSFEEISVYLPGHIDEAKDVKTSEVLVGDGSKIAESLKKHLGSVEVADRVFAYMRPRLRDTLTLDEPATKKALEKAVAAVQDVSTTVEAGAPLARAGVALNRDTVSLLRVAYRANMDQRTVGQRAGRALAMIVVLWALLLLCMAYFRYRRHLALSTKRWAKLVLIVSITATLAHWASVDIWRAETVPLLLFGMIFTIAYRQEMALVLCVMLAAIIALGNGLGLSEFLFLSGVSAIAILQLAHIRSRAKLIYVGLIAGAAAVVLKSVFAILDNPPLDINPFCEAGWANLRSLATDSGRTGLWVLSAGFLMTGFLPFIEKACGVLTDLSLLELGDVAHPLLQELIRRAPATYNHSITVGSLAEAAAESIDARGLLVRVGSYFHDIGKMLKPGYFVENQGGEASMHETLLPAMSTLIIIAHVKDGVDLGRQRHLPQPIIDLIEQHHGTTLVRYFYNRAADQHNAVGDDSELDENRFRYPGPKPQTKEAGVLMLADAVEGASRALVDPAPARIESLVCELTEQRLQDGQFDESGLTLRELRTVERSLIKSLTALYHGRIKYPEMRPGRDSG